MKKLRFSYSVDNFENPVLQTHYTALEALALERDESEVVVDHTCECAFQVFK